MIGGTPLAGTDVFDWKMEFWEEGTDSRRSGPWKQIRGCEAEEGA